MFGRTFKIQFIDDTEIYDSLCNQVNTRDFGFKLSDGLAKLFETHTTGILIASSKSFAIIKSENKFYFVDSHSCGPRKVWSHVMEEHVLFSVMTSMSYIESVNELQDPEELITRSTTLRCNKMNLQMEMNLWISLLLKMTIGIK